MILERATTALDYLDYNDRVTWYKAAGVLGDAFGDAAQPAWMKWSSQFHKFNERSAEAMWRGMRRRTTSKRASLGWLFNEAKLHGWRPRQDAPPLTTEQMNAAMDSQRVRDIERTREALERKRLTDWSAARRAKSMIADCELDFHDYFEAKGFPSVKGLVHQRGEGYMNREGEWVWVIEPESLLVPMRHVRSGAILAVQAITKSGEKKFVPYGCATDSAVHFLGGRGPRWWIVEGYATARSVLAAVQKLYRPKDRVVCTFSASKVASIAKAGKDMNLYASAVAIIDHDRFTCRESGVRPPLRSG